MLDQFQRVESQSSIEECSRSKIRSLAANHDETLKFSAAYTEIYGATSMRSTNDTKFSSSNSIGLWRISTLIMQLTEKKIGTVIGAIPN